MQMMQLSMYSMNVPKLEASTIMVKRIGKSRHVVVAWWQTIRWTRARAADAAIAGVGDCRGSRRTPSAARCSR